MTASEMRKLSEDGRLVVSYLGNVYDVTDFTGHPGGYGRLQMASGGDLEVFWKVYTQHNRGHIEGLLRKYQIGVLSESDARSITESTFFDNPYVNDPPTMPELLTNTRYPYNAEGRLAKLREQWITPIGRHFVRNHSHVPDIKEEDYRLLITGVGLNDTTFTLNELKTSFPRVTVTSVIQCNGNRREDYHLLDGKTPAFGPPHWVAGAIGNSMWTGVRLRDVLRAAGMDVDGISLGRVPAPKDAVSVGLLASDVDEVGNQYCCSFPFEKAIDPFGDVILAFEMNGVPIPRQHGFPVRAIVPGHAGARNCKYLERVTVTDTPCCDNSNWKQYAVHAPDVPLYQLQDFEIHAKALKKDAAVQEMPVQSFITAPAAGDVLAVSRSSRNGGPSAAVSINSSGIHVVKVKGIAWGGGGEDVNRVDVSIDGGKTFTRAELLPRPVVQRRGSMWSWVFFEQEIPLPQILVEKLKNGDKIDLVLTSKALNTSWNVQPENPTPNYNPHGCCVNHWYQVPVSVDPSASADVQAPEGDFANKPSGGKFMAPFRNLDQPPTERKRMEDDKAAKDKNKGGSEGEGGKEKEKKKNKI